MPRRWPRLARKARLRRRAGPDGALRTTNASGRRDAHGVQAPPPDEARSRMTVPQCGRRSQDSARTLCATLTVRAVRSLILLTFIPSSEL